MIAEDEMQSVLMLDQDDKINHFVKQFCGWDGVLRNSRWADNGPRNRPALGCLRTTEDAMDALGNLDGTDPATAIDVINHATVALRQGEQK